MSRASEAKGFLARAEQEPGPSARLAKLHIMKLHIITRAAQLWVPALAPLGRDTRIPYFAASLRSGKAFANASREAATTQRSVIRPVTSRAGVTSKP